MKKRILILSVLALLLNVSSRAHDFRVDGIFYNIVSAKESTCEVTYRYRSSSLNKKAYTDYVVIPKTVTYLGVKYSVEGIDDNAFSGCTKLNGLTIPNSVTSIGEGAFEDCSGLAGITIPDGVTEIGGKVFRGCTSLTEIILPNGVTKIGEGTFEGCTGLTSITIPHTVAEIGEKAFYDCFGLRSITSLNPEPPLCYDESSFKNVRMNLCKVYVPKGSQKLYTLDSAWGEFIFVEDIDGSSESTIAVHGMEEVVYLKDGSSVRGEVIEQTPNELLRILTADGSVHDYPTSEVEKVFKEKTTDESRIKNESSGTSKKSSPDSKRCSNLSKYKVFNEKGFFKFGIRAGMNASKIKEKYSDWDYSEAEKSKTLIGYHIGFIFDIPLFKNYLYIQPGLYLTQKGGKYVDSYSTGKMKEKINPTYLEFPILFSGRYYVFA